MLNNLEGNGEKRERFKPKGERRRLRAHRYIHLTPPPWNSQLGIFQSKHSLRASVQRSEPLQTCRQSCVIPPPAPFAIGNNTA